MEFLRANNFPALVTSDGEKLIATHLPVEVVETEGEGLRIYSHMSRANPQWKSFGEQEALLIFQGAHTYISPTWYNHVNVPTWNYRMVHVYGKARVVDSEELKSTHSLSSTLPCGFVDFSAKAGMWQSPKHVKT